MNSFYSAFLGFALIFLVGMKSKECIHPVPAVGRQEVIAVDGVAEFLVNTAHLNLMALKEGEEAIRKGTIEDIKAYGELMVRDKTNLLAEIRQLALARQVTLPEKLSEDNARSLEKLKSKSGVAFNKAFVKSIHCAHKQALKDFKKAASKLEDKEVSSFASKYINTINLQIIRIEKIKEKM